VEHTAMVNQVVDFIQRHAESRLTWWHRALDDHKPNTINRAGFKKQITKDGTPINSN
jgi:putative DNA primase/helicase